MDYRRISRRSVPLALLPIAAAGLLLLAPDPLVPPAAVPAPRPPRDRVVLEGGEELRGEVLREGERHVVVRSADGRLLLVERERVAEIQRGAPAQGPWRRVRLHNGRVLRGRLIAEGPTSLELELEAGTRITLRRADVASVASGR